MCDWDTFEKIFPSKNILSFDCISEGFIDVGKADRLLQSPLGETVCKRLCESRVGANVFQVGLEFVQTCFSRFRSSVVGASVHVWVVSSEGWSQQGHLASV